MLIVRAETAVREEHLHAEISIAVMVQLLKQAHCEVAVRRRVKRGVKMPIERTPARRFIRGQRKLELVQYVRRSIELVLGHVWNCATNEIAFDLGAQLEQFSD